MNGKLGSGRIDRKRKSRNLPRHDLTIDHALAYNASVVSRDWLSTDKQVAPAMVAAIRGPGQRLARSHRHADHLRFRPFRQVRSSLRDPARSRAAHALHSV